ncbi:MAG TPA: iron-containing alcohol dehydrogenase [Burkholderiaceae bacterium]|nr:iron-containing alcohol dehydrogenase [Burkholderiaceae bacterium]
MARFQYVTQIEIDPGVVRLLPQECRRLGIARPLVVSDAGVRAAGVLDRALSTLDGDAAVVFDQTPGNPNEAAVRSAATVYRAHGCDGLIAVGGGSSIDLAKGVAIAVTHDGPLARYATIEGGADAISDRVPALVAVPTTAGTGSEVARGTILIVDDGRKLGFHNWNLLPRVALLDPELTSSLPAGLTAATGMDAIAHCLETFMSAKVNPPADGIALDGLGRGWRHVERAVADGARDIEARWQMMSASMQGALAFQKGLGCVHSLSHALGGIDPRLHHGTLNAVFLPAVIRFNAAAESMRNEDRIARMAHAMGLPEARGDAGEAVAAAVARMSERLGLPRGLAAMGVPESVFDRVIDAAMKDHCHATNPRLASREDYLEMLRQSL